MKKIIENSNYIVVMTGAGFSTDSGIPDFRGPDGIYSKSLSANPEYYLSRDCLVNEPKVFFDYYRNNMMFADIKPNAAHLALAKLEKDGKVKAVVTQNIDGLHQKAGSNNVIELHGSAARCYCENCNKKFTDTYIKNYKGKIPCCNNCGGVVRPDITLYGESLDMGSVNDAINEIQSADTLIVAGTSLTVNPAASLVNYFRGKHFVIINYSETPYDNIAELIIRKNISEVFCEL